MQGMQVQQTLAGESLGRLSVLRMPTWAAYDWRAGPQPAATEAAGCLTAVAGPSGWCADAKALPLHQDELDRALRAVGAGHFA